MKEDNDVTHSTQYKYIISKDIATEITCDVYLPIMSARVGAEEGAKGGGGCKRFSSWRAFLSIR